MFTAVVRAYSSSIQIVACRRSLPKLVSGSRGIAVTWRRYLHGAGKSTHQRPRRLTMEGQFVVRELSEAPEDNKRRVVASVRYPLQELPDVVVSELELWEVDANAGGFFSLSYWRSIFNNRPDYNIILKQQDLDTQGEVEASATFVLHESSALDSSQQAFEQVRSTLEPLVDDGSVMMTEELLEEIITPKPREASRLVFELVEIMDKNPNAHPDWTAVLQSIMTPALQSENEEAVQLLLDRDVTPGTTNRAGETALHKAATSSKGKGIKKLIESAGSEEEKQRLLQQTNKAGKTSLHVAFEKDNPDAVRELVEAGAGFSTPVAGSEDSSNPLHLAAEGGAGKSVSAASNKKDGFLVKNHPDNHQHMDFVNALNMPNRKGFTPLMLAVKKGYLDSAMSLAAAGADPNICHPDTGNTALHLAAEVGNQMLVKLLLVFGADLKMKNKAGKTPVLLARSSDGPDAATCVKVLEEIAGYEDKISKLSNSFKAGSIPKESIFLLSMDGGGVRGLITCQALIALTTRMKQLRPDCGPLQSYFDYIAGTSAGAIVGLGLSHANTSPELCRTLCLKFAEDVCEGTPTFSTKSMETCLKESYGADLKIRDSVKPRSITTTVLGDMNPPVLHLICNYRETGEGDIMRSRDMTVWEAARASSAAPVYFHPFNVKYIDGGVMANNPTLDAMAEIFHQGEREGKDVRLGLVFSIGTGNPPSVELDDVGVAVPRLSTILRDIFNIGDTVTGLVNLLNQFISQSTQSSGQETVRADAWCKSMKTPYVRLSPPLSKIYDMAESEKDVLVQIMYEAHKYIVEHGPQIDTVAKTLLSRGPSK